MEKLKYVLFAFVLLMIGISMPAETEAATKTVMITSENYKNGKGVQEALNLQKGETPAYTNLKVVLKPGNYYITSPLIVYSNTSIEATGATIYYVWADKAKKENARAPILANYCVGAGGYSGAGNISVNGGTWDFQGKAGQGNYGVTMEAFRFMHGSNFRFTNLTMRNLYHSHFLTIEGVRQVVVQGCVFRDFVAITARKEAIHIDCMHNSSMAPSSQEKTVYDDTICNDIKVMNCSFINVPRGMGTHIAVAGLYPSNITIMNNSFSYITYEAIKAYHYKNIQISGNQIQNSGCGIKVYLYANPANNDKDEEGNANYLATLRGVKTEANPANLNVTISNNRIQTTTGLKNGYGIRVAGCKERIVSGVKISGNSVTPTEIAMASTSLAGIYVDYGNQVQITGNRIIKGGKTGIHVAESSNVNIQGNVVTASSSNGIVAQNCNVVFVAGNAVNASAKRNIYIKTVLQAKITGNRVSNDRLGGIVASKASTGYWIAENLVRASRKNGIVVNDSPQGTIWKNTIKSAAKVGIHVVKSDNTSVLGNTVSSSKSSGIVISNESGTTVEGNCILKPGKYGIAFSKVKKSSVTKNKVMSSKNYGIIYSADSKNRKPNVHIYRCSVKKGEKEVTGQASGKNMEVSVVYNKKTKKKKTKKGGAFKVPVKKLKKKKEVQVQVKDKWENAVVKTYKVK